MDVRANGIRFNCEIDGPEGAPWLTFSNSLATDLRMWAPQVHAFAGDYRILRYDKRGHGGSDLPPPPYDLAELVTDVVAIWDALGIEKSHLVGISIGGATALGVVLNHAQRVASIIIADARCHSTDEHKQRWAERVAIARKNGMAVAAEDHLRQWFTPAAHAAGLAELVRVREMISRTPVEGYAGCVNAVTQTDFADRLGEIRCPTLFICGADDIGDFVDQAHQMHGAVAGSELAILEGASHLCNLEKAQAFNQALGSFLTTCEVPGTTD